MSTNKTNQTVPPQTPPVAGLPPQDSATTLGRESVGSLCWFLVLCMVAGFLTGLAGGYFQYFLHMADKYRNQLASWAHTAGTFEGLLTLIAICVGCAVVGRFLVRFAPTAGGSGIQYVEAMWHNEHEPARLPILFVKFFGGLLTLGSGMALGREGPTVQMGASIGGTLGRIFKLDYTKLKFLTIASAGTGLGVAFSAPLGGAMFTFEEVTKDIKPSLVISTMLCVLVGCSTSMTILGAQPDYDVIQRSFAIPNVKEVFALILFGIFIGAMGVLYNKSVLILLNLNDYFKHILPEVKAGIVGIVVALLLWYAPYLAGGGDNLGQDMLNYAYPIQIVLIFGLIRWIFAPLCYSTGVPGGLFSPLLLMGGILGHVFAWALGLVGIEVSPLAFCAVGMSAFFGATIRAPFTGVLLILEMTACWDLTLAMIGASAVAFFTAKCLKDLPIYTALRLRIPEVKQLQKEGKQVLFG